MGHVVFLKRMFFRVGIVYCLLLLTGNAHAQISAGGTPPSFQSVALSTAASLTMPGVNEETLRAEDEAEIANAGENEGIAPRFAYRHEVNLNLNNSGSWSTLPNGDRIWRLRISSPHALAIHLTYNNWRLPKGAQLFIYNDDHSEVIGAFTSDNNWHDGTNITGLTHGDATTLEYVVPSWQDDLGELSISGVCHSYRSLFEADNPLDAYGQAAACNVNVNCSPQGDNWQDEKRGVALLVTAGGQRFCSGSLIRSACDNYDPLFYTAYHCLPAGSPSTWLFIFNYETPGCTNPGTEPSTAQSIANATHLADWRGADAGWYGNDFALMRLSSLPPASYNAYLNGWDRFAFNPTNVTGIHHPQGDVKKISNDDDFVAAFLYPGDTTAMHWLPIWDSGTTEGGSSGSPLFNSSGKIIGALHGGGGVTCQVGNDYSAYGMFHKSWEGNGAPDSRVKDHLDPCNVNSQSLDGFDLGPPDNDQCPGLNIGTGLAALPFSHDGNSTQSANDYTGSCADNTPGYDNVYQWTSQEAAVVTVGLCNSSFDTGLYVREGACDGTEVTCDDDACTAPNGLGSTLLFTACAHTTYYIFVDAYHANTGGAYTVTVSGVAAPVQGDLCSSPISVPSLPFSHSGNTTCLEKNDLGSCTVYQFPGRDVVYRWTSPGCPVIVSANTCNSQFDTGLYIREASCTGPYVACDDDACNSPNSAGSSLSFSTAPNTDYYFFVDGYSDVVFGTYTLEISSTPATIPGDLCSNTIAVSSLPYSTSGNTSCATDQDYSSCQNGSAPDLVYTLNLSPAQLGPCDIVHVSLCGSDFDTRLGVRTDGACPGTTDLGCNDDSFCGGVWGLESNVIFSALPNTNYYITVFGHVNWSGSYTLNITKTCPPESLVVSVAGSDIVLDWSTSPSGGPATYHVFRSQTWPVDPIQANEITTTSSTNYTDVNAVNNAGTIYMYVVTAETAPTLTEAPLVPVSAIGKQIGESVSDAK